MLYSSVNAILWRSGEKDPVVKDNADNDAYVVAEVNTKLQPGILSINTD